MDFNFLDDWRQQHLLVAGEVGIDQYIWGDTRRISPEAPVPVVEVESQSLKLGLGANVAQNLCALGARTTLISVRGQDADGKEIENLIQEGGIHHANLIEDPTRPTLRKVRIMARKQHVVRVDYEKCHPLTPTVAKQFRDNICDLIPGVDGVIVQDYGKGLWNPDIMGFVKHAEAHRTPIFVDPSRLSPPALYCGTTLLSPNKDEAEILSGVHSNHSDMATSDDELLMRIATKILERAKAKHVVITCGAKGMVSLTKGEEKLNRIPTFARDVFDVTGAGDTVISVLALMMVSGAPLTQCMQIANAAAGLIVAKIGAASVNQQELREELERLQETGLI